MCGITGAVWNHESRSVSARTLARMTEVLAHRGPDDRGDLIRPLRPHGSYGSVPGVAFGFRRLAVIDLPGGRQPMSNEDDSIWVIFNGEIYNHRDLRRRLEGNGHDFRTQSDTEVIVHLYEDEGERCFGHLNGMFALAIWDEPKRKLLLARDRLGQKPLVYAAQPDRVAFASEIKSLLQLDGIDRGLDVNALDDYFLYQYVPHPRTIYRGIRKLPPGHFATYENENWRIVRYWQPDFNEEQPLSMQEAASQLEAHLHSSVALRMQADVPLGAFLSGGVDSSLIVSLMREHTERKIQTFSVGFSIPEYDETSYARQVAKHLDTDHHEYQLGADVIDQLPEIIKQYDEPFADSSMLPTWVLAQRTSEHVTVALSGDGGDELFAGYPRYKAVRLSGWLDRSPFLRGLLGAKLWQRLPASTQQKSRLRRLLRFLGSLPEPSLRRYLDWIAIFKDVERAEIYRDDFLESLGNNDPFQFLASAAHRTDQRDAVTSVSLTDLLTYLPCDLMTKVDMASMAHHLEVRQPFLDFRLVEFAASLPRSLKMRGLRGKRLLAATFADRLPRSIWDRPKMGFGVPLEYWFRNEFKAMAADTLLSKNVHCQRFIRKEAIHRLWDEHQSRAFNHGYRLWSLLVFEMWLREWGVPES